MTAPMRRFGTFYMTLTRHEVAHPTSAQLDALRRVCEADNAVDPDAPWAERLFSVACEVLDGGDVGTVYRHYAEVAAVVMKVVAGEAG